MAIADKRVLNCAAIFTPEYMANTKTTRPISQYTTGIATSELHTPDDHGESWKIIVTYLYLIIKQLATLL